MCRVYPYTLNTSTPHWSFPRSVPGIIYGLQHYADVPSEMLEWHGHNDFYKGVVNATTAWLYGAGAVNCSLLGIGERTGNVPLEAMVFEYASIKGEEETVFCTKKKSLKDPADRCSSFAYDLLKRRPAARKGKEALCGLEFPVI